VSVFLWILIVLVALVWVLTAVDIFRRHTGWAAFGWLMLALVLPLVGSLIYWIMRKPTVEEIERQRLAEADLRHNARAR
jgi:hypothetical protein